MLLKLHEVDLEILILNSLTNAREVNFSRDEDIDVVIIFVLQATEITGYSLQIKFRQG